MNLRVYNRPVLFGGKPLSPVAIVLAGGANRRFWPMTQKSLLSFGDESLLDKHVKTLGAAGFVDIIVVGNPENADRLSAIAHTFIDVGVSVVIQPSPDGMGDAILQCAPLIRERFPGQPVLVSQVHDLVDPAIFGRLAKLLGEDPADGFVVGVRQNSYFPGGYLVLDGDRAVDVIEKPPPGTEPSNLVKIVADVIRNSNALFDALHAVDANPADQYENALGRLMAAGTFRAVDYDGPWVPIKFPWHVLSAVRHLLDQLPALMQARYAAGQADETGIVLGSNVVIEPGAFVSGPVVLEDNVRVLAGAVIRGPSMIGARTTIRSHVVVRNSMIGDDCAINPGAAIERSILGSGTVIGNVAVVRESILGRRCVAGYATEIARSYIGSGCWFHTNYIGDSVIGDNVSFGSGTTTANLRLDEKNIRVSVDGNRTDTGTNKIGAFIGSHVRVGINGSLMPGIRIGSNSVIGPAVLLNQDIANDQFVQAKQELDVRPNPVQIESMSRAELFGALRKTAS